MSENSIEDGTDGSENRTEYCTYNSKYNTKYSKGYSDKRPSESDNDREKKYTDANNEECCYCFWNHLLIYLFWY